jgi:hypothetical protein
VREERAMAKNGPKGGGRRGAVRWRIQYFNPRNNRWVKVDRGSGRIMDVKSNGKPFKSVTRGD